MILCFENSGLLLRVPATWAPARPTENLPVLYCD